MKRAQAIAPITSLQPPYSLVTREIEKDILPYTRRNNIGVIAYSPMAAGLLTGSMTKERAASLTDEDWRKRLPNFQEPLLSRNLRMVEFFGNRATPRAHSRAGRDCLDACQSGDHRCHLLRTAKSHNGTGDRRIGKRPGNRNLPGVRPWRCHSAEKFHHAQVRERRGS